MTSREVFLQELHFEKETRTSQGALPGGGSRCSEREQPDLWAGLSFKLFTSVLFSVVQ